MRLFDKTMTTIESSLDVRLARQNLLAGNVANADTPGFRPRDLDFASALAEARQRHDPAPPAPGVREGDLPLVANTLPAMGQVVDAAAGAPGIDGNRVDLDRTMVSLAENALQYGASTRSLTKKLSILRLVATEGGG